MRSTPGPLLLPFLLIRIAGVLTPRDYRASWREEWKAEIWHAWASMRERGEPAVFVRMQLLRFCRGSFADAAWYGWNLLDREHLARTLRSLTRGPAFCLASIAAILLLLAAMSGFFPMTQAILLPLPYENADRVATVAHSGVSAVRSQILAHWAQLWKSKSRLLEGVATYRWSESLVLDAAGRPGLAMRAAVSENFFAVLGVRPEAGRSFQPGDSVSCADCVLVSHDAWARLPASRVVIDSKRYRVIGVLDSRFWFLSRQIAFWSLAPSGETAAPRTGVVVRLGPDVQAKAARVEMESILHGDDISPWESLVEISPVQERVRFVLGSFALALALAVVMAIAGLRFRIPRFETGGFARASFFALKTGLLLLAVLLAGLEFTRAPSITMIGGTDLATEPLSTWLFLLGSMGALSWSIWDQSRRCRVCLRRLGLAAHVGCPGCLLLDWAGMELVCIEGHGMLHVPEMTSSWRDAEQWTALDDSWLELFARK